MYKYEAVFETNGDGYTVTVPKLPGLVTEGSTLQEARAMVRDAIRCYLGALLKDKRGSSASRIMRKEEFAISI